MALKSTEMLHEMMDKRGIKWQTSYTGALNKLVDVLDEEAGGLLFQKAVENTEAVIARAAEIANDAEHTYRVALQYSKSIESVISNAERVLAASKELKSNTVTDAQDAKTLVLYRSMLNAGKEVFGEDKMTDSAIESICESASYITYRTIMGGADEYRGRKR